MNETLNQGLPVMVLVTAVLCIILFIMVMVQGSKLKKLRRSYEGVMNGNGVNDLESVLTQIHLDMESMQVRTEEHSEKLQALKDKLRKHTGHIAVHRYNAFGEHGNDLSFSIALIDDERDGLVFTGIHGREHTYVYAKPLEKGQSAYALSPEEKQAVEVAANRQLGK
ncbi:DUF4446 family protein [Paenibacillus sp. UMB4589-SE434]|uniref:DUF4446 family protein n=1 Tax=Paenibacillus sp. UMB4589-SE434 TaxID=3046314 RepID=UPI002550CD32|nr:DUF4446 family protein [Paenibacillus sp. UMB4589-SE434]MDK8181235.1 DUF4446 family protein [Paenibacillus sp. UMB4589-SE434]